MSWTKRQYVLKAFSKIGKAAYVYDADPEELQDALDDLEAMMAEWYEDGIQMGWPIDDDLDTVTDMPRRANSAIYHGLALRIAPDYGITPAPRVRTLALQGYNRLLGHYTKPPQRKRISAPSGAGNRWRYGNSSAYNRFTRPRPNNKIAPPEQSIGFNND